MTDKIAEAIATLRGRDASAYRAARNASLAASAEYDVQSRAIAALGSRSYSTLERALIRAMKPHAVEWRRFGVPSESPHGGAGVSGLDWTTSAHLAGEVWPQPKGGKYNMHMRAHIPFGMSPRDADEFRRGVALLKAAADAMAEGGL